MITNKWRIFKKPLEVPLRCVGKIILASFWLHNFCINQREEKIPQAANPDTHKPRYEQYLDDMGNSQLSQIIGGIGTTREYLRRQLHAQGFIRPQYNIDRNK